MGSRPPAATAAAAAAAPQRALERFHSVYDSDTNHHQGGGDSNTGDGSDEERSLLSRLFPPRSMAILENLRGLDRGGTGHGSRAMHGGVRQARAPTWEGGGGVDRSLSG